MDAANVIGHPDMSLLVKDLEYWTEMVVSKTNFSNGGHAG
jgi:hypothetical protein